MNIEGTLNVLLAARSEGVQRVVCASSSSVYGDAPGFPREEGQTVRPLAPYAVSKLAAEQYCRAASVVYGLETVALRYFNVFGGRQDPFSQYSAVIPRFITALQRGDSPTVYGDGEQSRDFTHIDNIVQANLRAASESGVGGAVLNIGCGAAHSLNTLVAELNDILGTDIAARHDEPRPGDVRASLADISLARELIGYEPHVDFREGLRRTVESLAEDATGAVAGP